MPLEVFVQEELNRLRRFSTYWGDNSRADSKSFPVEMTAGEWLEQYFAWLNSKGKV